MKKRTKHQELRKQIAELEAQLEVSRGFTDAYQASHLKLLGEVFDFLSKHLTQDELAHDVGIPELLKKALLTAETNERRETLMEFKLLSAKLPPESFTVVHNLIARLEAGPWLKEQK